MKTWLANPDLSTVEVEEHYQTFAKPKRSDQYITVCSLISLGVGCGMAWFASLFGQVTLLQLKKKFGKGKAAREFIASITKGSSVLFPVQMQTCFSVRDAYEL